jgi:TonB family protein
VKRQIQFWIVSLVILAIPRPEYGGRTTSPIQSSQSSPPEAAAPPASPSPSPTFRYEISPQPGVTILSDTQGFDFKFYIQRLMAKVKAEWLAKMPDEARNGARGKVTVQFTVLPIGTVAEDKTQIVSGSGNSSLDQTAIDAVRRSSPFEPLPRQFHGPYLRLKVDFFYNMPPDSETHQTPTKKE